MSTNSDDPLPLRRLSELVTRPVELLWPGRLALGKLALLEGDPGLGKSLLTLDLCARLSTGKPMPDGSPGPGVCTAIVFNSEDDVQDTIRPRLQALGADLGRLLVFDRSEARGLLSLPADIGRLDRALAGTDARLVVLDPATSFLHPRAFSPNPAVARQALAPLEEVAARRRCAVLLNGHINKFGGKHAAYRGLGPIGFLGAFRSAWLLAADPEAPARQVLAQVKTNFAPQPSLGLEIVSQGADEPPRLIWLGPSPWTAGQLLAGAVRTVPDAGPVGRAADFLLAFLKDEPRTSRQVWAAAQEQGLAEHTLRNAKRAVGVRSVRVWADGQRLSYWLLPGQELPAAAPPPEADNWTRFVAEQEKLFPPASPFDEE
ncbi:MAG TPA: AAA family ATPase [Gemmataceae bacterium]|nr:AAA family ATPase [Gemmataceae bacterium]